MTQFTLADVSVLMDSIRPMAKGVHLLFVKDGSLCLSHRTTSPVSTNLLCEISASEIIHGLTPPRWDFIDKKLKEYNDQHAA